MDRISSEQRSKIMSKIKSKNTSPELLLRKELFLRGLRYRIHHGEEKIDICFTPIQLAVFVDGCFWHQCPIHSHVPKSNLRYWTKKLKLNKERAVKKDQRLRSDGWSILHIWEHEIKDGPLAAADTVQRTVRELRSNAKT